MSHLTGNGVLAAFWILDPLYTALGTVLAWFYEVIPSYGMAIVLLTLAVRLLTFPLTAKQARSQQQLQKLQPELKRLQAKYKGDKPKLNEEMMKFYKEHHVNPLGGCLPLFIQFPVLIVLYRLILGLSRTFIVGFAVVVGAAVAVGGAPAGPLSGVVVQGGHVSDGSLSKGVVTKGELDEARAVVDGKTVGTINDAEIVNGKIATAQVMNGEVVVGTITDLSLTGGQVAGAPKNVPESSSLYSALKADAGKMQSFGMDLAKRASDESGSALIPYLLLVLGVGATGFYQQRQLTGRLPKESANSQMAVMGKVFPLIFVFISWTIPAGVVVYFLVSNIWQIGQQAFMFRNQPKPEPGPADAKKAKLGPTPPAGKGKGKGKPTPSRGGRGTTTGKLSKGAKSAGPAGVTGKRAAKTGGTGNRAGNKSGGTKAGAGKGSGNQANGNKGTGNRADGNRGSRKRPYEKPQGTKAPGNKRRTEHGAPRPKGQARRPDPQKPAATSGPEVPATGSGPDTGSVAPKRTDAPQNGDSGETTVGGRSEPTAPPPTPADPPPSEAEPQGSNGSTPLATPLPPAAGDRDKDGE